MGKRELQTIVKTDERDIASSSGVMGNLPLNQAVGAKTEFSSRATSSRSQSRRRWLLTHLPMGSRPAAELVRCYFPDD